jgi:tetratricopeptide (TPR) repeat protein
VVIDRALAWLNGVSPRPALPAPSASPAPFFLWVHLYDPHAPYNPPPEFRARAATPYDGEVAYVDAQLARLLDALRTKNQLERTVLVIVGDHGEGLGDHGERTHGMLVYDSTLRVPLVIAAPGAAAARRDEAVSLAEIAPTILASAGVAIPQEMKGRDLLRLEPDTTTGTGSSVRLQPDPAAARGVRLQPDLYSETDYPRAAGWSPLQALTDGRWKVIRAGAASEVYDIQSDPQEQHDLAASQANAVSAMTSRIAAIRSSAPAAAARTVSPETEKRLRSLGYVASAGATAANADAPNPAAHIGDWNAFEDALASLNARRGEALPSLQILATRNPDALVFQATYARALKEAGKDDRALAVYRAAAGRWPTDATLLHDLAVAARDAAAKAQPAGSTRLREEAARADQAAIALSPASAPAHNGLGLLAIDADRPHDAAPEFQRATELDPNNAGYWTNLGNARRALGDRAGAEQAYRRALEVDTREADAANGLGVLLVEARRPADAVPWLERATEAAPDFVEARLNLGIALQQAGQPERAAAVYRTVLSAPPQFKRERDAAAKLLAGLATK